MVITIFVCACFLIAVQKVLSMPETSSHGRGPICWDSDFYNPAKNSGKGCVVKRQKSEHTSHISENALNKYCASWKRCTHFVISLKSEHSSVCSFGEKHDKLLLWLSTHVNFGVMTIFFCKTHSYSSIACEVWSDSS